MTFGQPPDTAAMSFEGSRSMVWVMESLHVKHWSTPGKQGESDDTTCYVESSKGPSRLR
jgi:hypothetical protein